MWYDLPSALISMLFIIDACFDGNRRDILFLMLCCVRSETCCSPRITFSDLLKHVNAVVAAQLVHDSDYPFLWFLSIVEACRFDTTKSVMSASVSFFYSRLNDAPSMR